MIDGRQIGDGKMIDNWLVDDRDTADNWLVDDNDRLTFDRRMIGGDR